MRSMPSCRQQRCAARRARLLAWQSTDLPLNYPPPGLHSAPFSTPPTAFVHVRVRDQVRLYAAPGWGPGARGVSLRLAPRPGHHKESSAYFENPRTGIRTQYCVAESRNLSKKTGYLVVRNAAQRACRPHNFASESPDTTCRSRLVVAAPDAERARASAAGVSSPAVVRVRAGGPSGWHGAGQPWQARLPVGEPRHPEFFFFCPAATAHAQAALPLQETAGTYGASTGSGTREDCAPPLAAVRCAREGWRRCSHATAWRARAIFRACGGRARELL